MSLFDPQFATRRRLKTGLVVAGALAGFVFGLVLTRLGKIVAGAPPATMGNYLWNAVTFAIVSGICSPVISWSFLRRAPLWRTVVEPLLWAAAGGATAVTLGVPALLLLLPAAGIVLGVLNLQRRYPEASRPILESPATPRLDARSDSQPNGSERSGA